jgi:hypothetical protein
MLCGGKLDHRLHLRIEGLLCGLDLGDIGLMDLAGIGLMLFNKSHYEVDFVRENSELLSAGCALALSFILVHDCLNSRQILHPIIICVVNERCHLSPDICCGVANSHL